MSDWPYSENELNQYLSDPQKRMAEPDPNPKKMSRNPLRRYWAKRFDNSQKVQAATAISYLVAALLVIVGIVGVMFLTLMDELPPMTAIENPKFQLATIAYTADGEELARYALQNRSWVSYDELSPWLIKALVSTEDHRFYKHWGIDLFRLAAVPFHMLRGRPDGASTLSQQLARNLYNDLIGKERKVSRKLKEMVTECQIITVWI